MTTPRTRNGSRVVNPLSPREVTLNVVETCPAPAERVWETLVDWKLHERWMVLTRASGGAGEGARVEAFTGIGALGVRDPMEITRWLPATGSRTGRCAVRHTGRVVRGTGEFQVIPLLGGHSRVVWTERVELPLGLLGAAGWRAAAPVAAMMLRRSLRNLGRVAAEDCEETGD